MLLALFTVLPLPALAADNDAVSPVYHAPGFWDGQWTDASSGYHYSWPDPGDSNDKSGNKPKDQPQNYWIPDPRQFEDIDPEQTALNQGWNYTPFGQIMIWQTVTLPNGQKIGKGYYQIRLGQYDDGSQKTRLSEAERQEIITQNPPPQGQRPPRNVFDLEGRIQRQIHVMILYKVGKVVAVLPIMERMANHDLPEPVAKPPLKTRLKSRLVDPVVRLGQTRMPQVPKAKLMALQNQLWVEVRKDRMIYRSRVS